MDTVYYVVASPAASSAWSNVGPVVLGFVLTTLIGGIFTWRLQALSAARQTRLELFRRRYDEGTTLLAEVSTLLDSRHFALQRLMWAIADNDDAKISAREKEYFKVVVRWNNSLRSNRNKIRLLIGDPEADAFLDYKDDARPQNPASIHYKFVMAHRGVLSSKLNPEQRSPAQNVVTHLNYSISGFLERLTTEFTRRANSLAILEPPPPVHNQVTKNGTHDEPAWQ